MRPGFHAATSCCRSTFPFLLCLPGNPVISTWIRDYDKATFRKIYPAILYETLSICCFQNGKVKLGPVQKLCLIERYVPCRKNRLLYLSDAAVKKKKSASSKKLNQRNRFLHGTSAPHWVSAPPCKRIQKEKFTVVACSTSFASPR